MEAVAPLRRRYILDQSSYEIAIISDDDHARDALHDVIFSANEIVIRANNGRIVDFREVVWIAFKGEIIQLFAKRSEIIWLRITIDGAESIRA